MTYSDVCFVSKSQRPCAVATLAGALLLSALAISPCSVADGQLRSAAAARTISTAELQQRSTAMVSAGSSIASGPAPVAAGGSDAEAGLVHINTASAEALSAGLTGIGQAKAEAIVRFRETNGSFMHLDELLNVPGIGPATIQRNQKRLKL